MDDFDGTIKLWPMVALGEPVVITHGSPVSSLAALRDGRLTLTIDETLRLRLHRE